MEDMGKRGDDDAVPLEAGQLVDLQALRELIELMDENGLVELEYEYGDLAVRLSKRAVPAPVAAAPAAAPLPATAARPAEQGAPAAAEAAETADDDHLKITSPMVGTFYWSAGPDAKQFVSAGDTVNPDTVVCLIEAMKVFNEIKAGVSGTISKVCVENEAAVEFDQVLFLIEPN